MKFQNYVIFAQYVLLYNIIFFNVPSVSSLAGKNIRDARVNEFPFIAGIIRRSRQFIASRDMICTGSLISEQDVLTASHCLEHEEQNGVQIIIGSIKLSTQTHFYPSYWILYDQWALINEINNGFSTNDIMTIKLTRKVPNASLGQLSYLGYSEVKEKFVITIGWGEIGNDTFPRLLQVGKLKIIKNDDCMRRCEKLSGILPWNMEKNIVCSRAKPYIILLGGDSGGPVLFDTKIVAINIATMPLPDQRFHPEKNNVHILLKYYKEFLKENIKHD